MSKVETLVGGIKKLVEAKEIDDHGLVVIAPELGMTRQFISHGIFGADPESDAAYAVRAKNLVMRSEGIAEVKGYYEILLSRERRAIGRKINEVRIR